MVNDSHCRQNYEQCQGMGWLGKMSALSSVTEHALRAIAAP